VTGAWGLGWEVWLNGLEITQFTYFQQSGGQTLDPISLELTYGMERIAMALQGVRDFRDLQWNQERTYGDVYLTNEQESSKYAFELADVERLRQMYDLYEAESKACLESQQVIPAHDYMLKCSHTFNVLDTRGAVGVTERAGFFRRMRGLSLRVAEAYVEQRQRLEFPWLSDQEPVTSDQESGTVVTQKEPSHLSLVPSHLLVEIGTEELPHTELEDTIAQLRERVPAMLEELRLVHGEVKIYGTPRRLVAYVEDLAPTQADLEEIVKGPPANRAFDADGAPTRAAQGFARSKGVEVSDLEIQEIDGGEYVTAVVRQQGKPAHEVLPDALNKLIANLHSRKSMRWNHTNVAFSRPIRWLLALHGETLIPFEYAGLQAANLTRGLRFLEPQEIIVHTPADYFAALAEQGIILDQAERKEEIQRQINALAAEVGGEISPDPGLLTEVTHLVEAPTALRGEFAAAHLELPREVLISVMKKHQRNFPVQTPPSPSGTPRRAKQGAGGEGLLPYYITVANKPPRDDAAEAYQIVTQGNGDVIRARFTDAGYFVRIDTQKALEDYVPALDLLTFQVDLGSMGDKTKRVAKLVDVLAPMLGLTPKELSVTRRAAQLSKADLATQMVVDMTSLQGVMGYHYALNSGETEGVAAAIREHYLPASADDPAPAEKPGLAVGVADRLDTLTGLFAAGLAPTGNKDPFAQRRAALGLVGNLIAWDADFDLRAAIDATAGLLPIEAAPSVKAECLDFIQERLRNHLLDEKGYAYHAVDAVLAAQGHNPAGVLHAVEELSAWIARADWTDILDTYARCVRITRDQESGTRYQALPNTEPAEEALLKALEQAEAVERKPGSVDDFFAAFLPIMPAVKTFFDDVLVMADDDVQRANRLGILQRIAALANDVADFSRLEGF
ncbi:MAG: glycine--tRNA ligase subunit beta, partial [Chloroflexota bacterium]|nr:glycine--tRNA ligase subunit beta [Chloroflexota bacterium]